MSCWEGLGNTIDVFTMMVIPTCLLFKIRFTYSLKLLIPKEVRRDQMIMGDKREKEKTHNTSQKKKTKNHSWCPTKR